MNSPSPFVALAFLTWVVLAPVLFRAVRARWALLASLALGWMFLPVYEYDWAGLPGINKMMMVGGAALLGAVLFDHRRVVAFRPSWIDIPMAAWCVAPFLSVMANGPFSPQGAPDAEFWYVENLTTYDAFSAMWEQVVSWGVPYFLGRIYLGSRRACRDALVVLFFAGVIYIPLCLFEFRMSPQLHRILYGFHQHDFGQTLRFGGYRPMVFMDHGLMVSFWIAAALIAGVHLWAARVIREVRGVPIIVAIAPLIATAVLMRSLGAWLLAAAGVATVLALRHVRVPILVAVLALVPPVYVTARVAGGWSGEAISDVVAKVSPERADSFKFRLENEDLLTARAMRRPVFGWAGWSRNRVYDDYGNDISVSDGQWVLALGLFGVFGVVSLYAWLLVPTVLALVRAQGERRSPGVENVVVAGLISLLFALDSVPNAMANPYFVAMIGGLATWWVTRHAERAPSVAQDGGRDG